MDNFEQTSAFLLGQLARYPALEFQDLLKALHQSVFGCGHFVTDRDGARRLLREELAALPPDAPADTEPLDGPFCRVHLGCLEKTGLAPETLLALFLRSAETPAGTAEALEAKLAVLLDLVRRGQLPFSSEAAEAAASAWRAAGFPPCHHSPRFRAAYAPAYRVLRRDLVRLLPLLSAIDRQLAGADRVLLAIDGGSASGKTTLAALLATLYPGCRVFHIDDFFLRPSQRTAERLAEPGGNVDRERFWEEVLLPLSRNQTVSYRRYDCHTQTLEQPQAVPPGRLNIVEGAYSLHPDLSDCYDLKVFLRVKPEVQQARILARNGPETGARFFTQWIPLEERYFTALAPADRCDLILEVEE